MENVQNLAPVAGTVRPVVVPPSTPAQPHPAAGEPEPRAAAERVAAEMAALSESEVVRLNLEATAAVTAVLGHWPALETLRPAIEALSPAEAARTAKLRDYALALYHWQSCVLSATGPDDVVGAYVEAGIAMRDRALADLTAAANRGLIDAASLQNYRGSASHRKLALDLAGLSALVHDRWSALQGKTLLTLEEADLLAVHGQKILEALGSRDRSPSPVSAVMHQRDRAFTLFQRAYAASRRAVEYLRYYHDDADDFVPPIYVGKRSGPKDEPAAKPASAAPSAPSPTAPAATSSLIAPSAAPSTGSPFEGA